MEELTEPVHTPGAALAAATLGAAPTPSPFSTPLWSWPQRGSEPNPMTPPPGAAKQESPMAKPDEPASTPSRSRSPLPGVKRAPTAQPAAAPPAAAPPAPAAAAPTAAAPKEKEKGKEKDRNDATMVMSPPPPAATAPAAQRATSVPTPAPAGAPAAAPRAAPALRGSPTSSPAPAASIAPAAPVAPPAVVPPAVVPPAVVPPAAAAPAAPPRRAHSDTLDEVVMELTAEAASNPGAEHSGFTADDLAAVRGLFNDVAVAHVSQVRDVMLELRYGETDPKWIEMTKPALRSLRAMAAQMELGDLCEALDAFCAAVDAAVQSNARVSDEGKAELQQRYSRLIELIPQAFELDAERDRREPIIVQALLCQVPGVEQPTIEKLFSVGLGRLDALMASKADEVAAVTGLRPELAKAIVEQFRSYRASASAAMSAPDPAVELRHLGDLLIMLSLQNDDFTRASTEWSDEAQQRKRQLRKQREQTFQQIKVALARLGAREQLQKLEKLSFQDRIATIDRFLSSQHPARPAT